MNKIADFPNYFKQICSNCGCTYGSHHGGTSPYPRDYCPGNEGRMDWENGPGTVFKHSGKYKCACTDDPRDMACDTCLNSLEESS